MSRTSSVLLFSTHACVCTFQEVSPRVGRSISLVLQHAMYKTTKAYAPPPLQSLTLLHRVGAGKKVERSTDNESASKLRGVKGQTGES